VELLETIEVDESVINRCYELRKGGYSLALDDWVARDPRKELLPLVDCVKVDLMGAPIRSFRRSCEDFAATS